MTQNEIAYIVKEERNGGQHIVVIIPLQRELRELPSSDEIIKKVKLQPREMMISQIDDCYATDMSRVTRDEEIDKFVTEVFKIAKIDSASSVMVL